MSVKSEGEEDSEVRLGFEIVMLNLFNHVLALFLAKFARNLEIRYLVFRWDLCKGCV